MKISTIFLTALSLFSSMSFANLRDEWNSRNTVSCAANLDQQINDLTRKFYGDKVAGGPQETTAVPCNVRDSVRCNESSFTVFESYVKLINGQICKFHYTVLDNSPCEIAGTSYENLGCR